MNNKGFTLVELITTFALSSIIIVLLINIVAIIKDVYSETNLKTELYINQGNLSNILNEKLNGENITSYEICSSVNFCYNFILKDGEKIKLVASKNKIIFGKYTYNLPSGATVGTPTLSNTSISVSDKTKNNAFLVLQIPIECSLYPNLDFGINLVYPYNTNKIKFE